MQNFQKNSRNETTKMQMRSTKDQKNSVKAINKYLSQVEYYKEDSRATFENKKIAFGATRPDSLAKFRKGLNLQPSQQQNSVFLQSKLSLATSNIHKYFSQKQIQDMDKSAQIAQLTNQVQQQRTIIQLQQQLINRLIAKAQSKQVNFDRYASDGSSIDKISSIVVRLRQAREILQFVNE